MHININFINRLNYKYNIFIGFRVYMKNISLLNMCICIFFYSKKKKKHKMKTKETFFLLLKKGVLHN